MKLNQEQLDLLQHFCDEHDYEFRKDYSGRGMYGKTCIGFVIDINPFELALDLVQFLNEHDPLLIEYLRDRSDCRQDSMGRDTIIYFQNLHI